MTDPLSKKKFGVEQSLFGDLPEDQRQNLPMSPTEIERKRAQKRRREAAQEEVRTADEQAKNTQEILAEWVAHLRSQGISETEVPGEIRGRVGRSLKALISKGYLYDEIIYAMRTWTVRDFQNRRYMPKTGMIEVYARQYRGETRGEAEAMKIEHERARAEALSRGAVVSTGTHRQRSRDSSMQAILRGQYGGTHLPDQNTPRELEQ